MERRSFLRILYENHPDKSRIKTGKRVVDVEEQENGVIVKLEDGTTEHGDILIGCDGVHSTVRELMWQRTNEKFPHLIDCKEKQCV